MSGYEILEGATVLDWIGEKLADKYSEPSHAIGLALDGKIITGFVFTARTAHDIEMGCVIEPGTAVPRRFYRFLTEYCFDQLKLSRMSATTANEKVADLLERYGFVREGIRKHVYGKDKHGIALALYAGQEMVK